MSARLYSRHKREQLFHAFLAWEQDYIVVPNVAEAFADFDWPLIAWLARRSVIQFAYFGKHKHLRFRDFGCRDERLAAGMQACRIAEDLGLEAVEEALGVASSRC